MIILLCDSIIFNLLVLHWIKDMIGELPENCTSNNGIIYWIHDLSVLCFSGHTQSTRSLFCRLR